MARRSMRRQAIGIAWLWIGMAAVSAMAQESAGTVTETVTTKRDLNGRDTVVEKVVTHRTRLTGEERLVVETYAPVTTDGRLSLNRRVSRVSTVRNDGSETVEETTEHNPAAPGDPLRVTQRTVTTVRTSGPDSYVVQQQVFQRDVNGRLALVDTLTESASPD